MKLRNDTAQIQELLGFYCKTGEDVKLPGITEGRVHHYRRLVYNVVKNTMDQAYPISVASMDEEEWDKLVNDFFSKHQTSSTQIWKLPYEFYQYHFSNSTAEKIGKPWLNDLLYFEWTEIEIHTMPDREVEAYVIEGDPLKDRILLNPEYELLQLSYPVHLHAVQDVEANKGRYYVLVYREPETGNVKFLDLSVLHAFILSKLIEDEVPINSIKGDIAHIANVESEKYLDEYLVDFVKSLCDRQMIFGFYKN